jgi:chemotaxis protein histidine kinase CheA
MPKDDDLDKTIKTLDEEIDAKVDSLFVESEEGEGDQWRELKEQFLTLEWEIDRAVLERILEKLRPLKEQYTNGTIGQLLNWLNDLTNHFLRSPEDMDKEHMKIYHNTKDMLLQFIDDPKREAGPELDELGREIEGLLTAKKIEAPSAALDAAEGEKGVLFEELERMEAAEEAPTEEAVPSTEEIEPSVEGLLDGIEEESLEDYKETVIMQTEELAPSTTEEVSEEKEGAPVELQGAEGIQEIDLESLKKDLLTESQALQGLLRNMEVEEGDPFGIKAHFRQLEEKIGEFSNSLQRTVESLQRTISAVAQFRIPEVPSRQPQPAPEEEGVEEEVLLFSFGSRIFGIPMTVLKGIFRVPSAAVSHVMKRSHITLRGREVEILPFWRKLGLSAPFLPFPKDDKRILLLEAEGRQFALIVDKALARKRASVRPVEEEGVYLFKGKMIVEKQAMIVDVSSL